MVGIPRSKSGQEAIDVAWRCARDAGAHALSRFRAGQIIDVKGHRNIVTQTDVECELRIKAILEAEYPDHLILSEETSSSTDATHGWSWVVDPIDGTKNYAIGVPFWCVNIALCLDGEPVLGLTYDPVHEEGFWALQGGGAFVAETPIGVSARPDVFSSVIGLDLGYDDTIGERQLRLLSGIFPNVQGFRITGSAALGLAYVACGRLDLYLHLNISPWDIAPGILLIREAGGIVTDRDGAPMRIFTRQMVAGAPGAHADFLTRYADSAWE